MSDIFVHTCNPFKRVKHSYCKYCDQKYCREDYNGKKQGQYCSEKCEQIDNNPKQSDTKD